MTSKPTEQIAPENDDGEGSEDQGLVAGAVLDHGRYRLLAKVGTDVRCSAELWRAKDGVLGRDVALTILTGDRSDAQAATNARRTLERAMHASTFNHVGVARVLDVVTQSAGDPSGVLGIVIAEWTHGTDLVDLIAEGPLPPGTAARLLQPLAAAVESAHHAGLVLGADHPQRIRVTPDGEIRMAYPGPMADAGSTDDVRGLGACLYLLLTGKWALEDGIEGVPTAPTGPDGTVVAPRTLQSAVPLELSTVAVRALGSPDATGTTGGVRTGAAVLRVLEQYATNDTDNAAAARAAEAAENNEVWRTDDPRPDPVKRKKLAVSVGILSVATFLVVGWLAVHLIGLFSEPPADDTTTIGDSGNDPTGTDQPATELRIAGADPFTSNDSPDNPNSIRYLSDGDPSTNWGTSNYNQQLGPGGISDGTGAVLRLENPAVPKTITVDSPSAGTEVQVRTVDGEPAVDSGQLLGQGTLQPGQTEIPLKAQQPTDEVLVIITKLSEEGGGFSSTINEITVAGNAG